MKEEQNPIRTITSYDYTLNKKVWDWLDIYNKICDGNRLVSPWLLDEVLEVTWSDSGKNGILITFDDVFDNNSSSSIIFRSKTSTSRTHQIRREIIKRILLNKVGGEAVIENGVEKYHIYANNTEEMFELCKEYIIGFTKGDYYKTLDTKYFNERLGNSYYFDGFYDEGCKKLIFTAIAGYGIKEENDLIHKLNFLFNGINKKDGVYMYSFYGSLEVFDVMCKLINK